MPPWWSEPIVGVLRFLDSNLNRAQSIPINIEFLGRIYVTPRDSLPWYNTLAWTVFVTPVGFLLLGCVGIWTAVRHWRTEAIGVLFVGHWAFLMILRALPHVPGHDGVRLFLPAFGLSSTGRTCARRLFEKSSRIAKLAISAALIEGAVSIAVMMPRSSCTSAPWSADFRVRPKWAWSPRTTGMHSAPELARWLADNTPSGRTIEFREFPLAWLDPRGTGERPRRLARVDRGEPQWFVLQNRPGAFSDVDRALIESGHAAYIVRKLGVPLIWVFPYTDLEGVLRSPKPLRQAYPCGRGGSLPWTRKGCLIGNNCHRQFVVKQLLMWSWKDVRRQC